MRESPILLSASMVRATLDSCKLQTRANLVVMEAARRMALCWYRT